MFGINTPELILIVIVAVLVIGPTRLPGYVEKLKNLIREVRKMAAGARETIKEEAGLDIDEIDWKKLDPRQYDPRRIIREALLDDDDVAALNSLKAAPGAAIASMLGKDGEGTPVESAPAAPAVERLAEGQRARGAPGRRSARALRPRSDLSTPPTLLHFRGSSPDAPAEPGAKSGTLLQQDGERLRL